MREAEGLVFVAEAGDTAEASVLRSYLEDHGIYVYVQGENHRGLLGQVGAYIALRVMVPAAQAGDARSLIAAFHEGVEVEEPPEFRGAFRDDGADDPADDLEAWRGSARRRTAIRAARVFCVMWPAGGGHFVTGAWLGGLALMALTAAGIAGGIARHPALFVIAALVPVVDWLQVPGLVDRRHQRAAADSARD